jgi:deoxyguanosine kinase
MLIAIEGCVGAGKSTVARGLASLRNSALLLEDFESNPFLRDFYADPVVNALETEFAFLLLHFHQLKGQFIRDPSRETIADFHFGKDMLYADLNLPEARSKQLFQGVYQYCSEVVPTPALIIFLSSSTDLLLRRIRSRNRDFEMDIDAGYYASVNSAYEDFFSSYSGKKLSVPMDEWDFVTDPSLFDKLSLLADRELCLSK